MYKSMLDLTRPIKHNYAPTFWHSRVDLTGNWTMSVSYILVTNLRYALGNYQVKVWTFLPMESAKTPYAPC